MSWVTIHNAEGRVISWYLSMTVNPERDVFRLDALVRKDNTVFRMPAKESQCINGASKKAVCGAEQIYLPIDKAWPAIRSTSWRGLPFFKISINPAVTVLLIVTLTQTRYAWPTGSRAWRVTAWLADIDRCSESNFDQFEQFACELFDQ